jgi:predicted phosphodiesterase
MAVSVFAVEDTAAQLVVRDETGVRVTEVGGLEPGARQRVGVGREAVEVETLAPPPGRLLAKVATLGDLHLGARRHFRVREHPEPEVAHPLRCARAALAEALAWGAELIVLKGDLTQHSHPSEWEQLAAFLDEIPVPVELLIGNHETMRFPGRVDPRTALALLGRPFDDVRWVDVPGARLVLVDTTTPDRGIGRVHHVHRDAVTAAANAPGAALVVLHHHLERWPLPTFVPPGVPRGQGMRLLDGLTAANPALFVTSGHSHRNRMHRHVGIPVTEVGSVKDYPGVWAGYALHEGGIRQVVRRVAAPDCVTWTERTRRAFAGAWGRWTPGSLAQRCLSHDWPTFTRA